MFMAIEKINEPMLPEIVFFGLNLVSLGPWKILPKKSPPTSDAIHINKHKKIKTFVSWKREARKKKNEKIKI